MKTETREFWTRISYEDKQDVFILHNDSVGNTDEPIALKQVDFEILLAVLREYDFGNTDEIIEEYGATLYEAMHDYKGDIKDYPLKKINFSPNSEKEEDGYSLMIEKPAFRMFEMTIEKARKTAELWDDYPHDDLEIEFDRRKVIHNG